MELENFDPRSCISGKVMRISRITSKIFRKHLGPQSITNSQASILFILSKRKDLNQKALADITELEKSSLNRNLKRLIADGYIAPNSLPKLQISKLGLEKVKTILPHWQNAMTEVRSILEEDGETAVNTVLAKMKN